MRKHALGEVKRILKDKKILAQVVDEITNVLIKLEKYPKRAHELNRQDVLELGQAASRWRREISRELESIDS